MRSSKQVFKDIPKRKIDPEMLELAGAHFTHEVRQVDPDKFGDRYEKALAELVKAKVDRAATKAPAVAPKSETP